MVKAALIALGGLLVACADVSAPRPPAWRSAAQPFAPQVVRPPGPGRAAALGAPELLEMEQLFDELETMGAAFAANSGGNRDVLFQLESYFPRLGRLDDLMGLYRAAAEREGPGSMLQGRLAVLYTRVGLRTEARALLDAGLAAAPASVDAQFAQAYWLASGSQAEIEQARALLAGIAEREPAYPGTGLVTFAEVERLLIRQPDVR